MLNVIVLKAIWTVVDVADFLAWDDDWRAILDLLGFPLLCFFCFLTTACVTENFWLADTDRMFSEHLTGFRQLHQCSTENSLFYVWLLFPVHSSTWQHIVTTKKQNCEE